MPTALSQKARLLNNSRSSKFEKTLIYAAVLLELKNYRRKHTNILLLSPKKVSFGFGIDTEDKLFHCLTTQAKVHWEERNMFRMGRSLLPTTPNILPRSSIEPFLWYSADFSLRSISDIRNDLVSHKNSAIFSSGCFHNVPSLDFRESSRNLRVP